MLHYFQARLVRTLIYSTCGHFGQYWSKLCYFLLVVILGKGDLLSVDHSRSTGPENVFVWSEEKGFFFSNIVSLATKRTKVCVLSNKEVAVVCQLLQRWKYLRRILSLRPVLCRRVHIESSIKLAPVSRSE